jgi:hypothetical protein
MNDDNFYINTLLSIKGPNGHFARFKYSRGLWESCKLLHKNRPLEFLPVTGDIEGVVAMPTCRVRTAAAMKRQIPAHFDKTEWLMNSEVLRRMVELGVEWPKEMRRVRVTVSEEVTGDVVEVFRAIKNRDTKPEIFRIEFEMMMNDDLYHDEKRDEILDMFRHQLL